MARWPVGGSASAACMGRFGEPQRGFAPSSKTLIAVKVEV